MATRSGTKYAVIIFSAILLLGLVHSVDAARIVSAGDGDWDVAETWTGGIPDPEDDVFISDTVSIVGDYHVNISSLGVAGTLVMEYNETAKLNVTGNLTIESGGTINLGDLNSEASNVTIISTGHLNSTLGTLNVTDGNWTNNGSFTHNSGRVFFSGGTSENQSITGDNETTFFNVNITNVIGNVIQEQNMTVLGVLDVGTGAGYTVDATDKNVILAMGNVSGGHTKITLAASGSMNFSGNTVNHITIQGANAQHQTQITDLSENIDLDSGGAGSLINLKWIDWRISDAIATGGAGVSINITGNITKTGGQVTVTGGDTFNATVPRTNISGIGEAGDRWKFGGNTYLIGDPAIGKVMFWTYDGVYFETTSDLDIFHVVFTGGDDSGDSVQYNANADLLRFDNVTFNATNRTNLGNFFLDDVTRDVLITNSTFAGEAPAHTAAVVRNGQIRIEDSNLTCIRCNFSLVTSSGLSGYVISINATDPATGDSTNNTNFWGWAVSEDDLNATLGAQISNWSNSTNLTLHQLRNPQVTELITTNLVFDKNITIANITLTNGTILNISAGNSTTVTGNLWMNGTLELKKDSNLTVDNNVTIGSIGVLNNREGLNPLTFGALTIYSSGFLNSTAGNLNITNGNWSNSGGFTHNSGRVIFGGGTSENQSITGDNETTFFNVNITNRVVRTIQEQNMTVEGVLEIGTSTGYVIDSTDKHVILTFGNTTGGRSRLVLDNSSSMNFSGNVANPVTIQGANAMHHSEINERSSTVEKIDWDSGGSGSIVNIKWLNFNVGGGGIVTGGNGVTINATGNFSINNGGQGFTINGADIFNATQPGTNISGDNGAGTNDVFALQGNTNIIGDPGNGGDIMFWGFEYVQLRGTISMRHAVISSTTTGSFSLYMSGNPTINYIDNITVNNTARTSYGSLAIENIAEDVWMTNSSFTGESNVDADPEFGGYSAQIWVDGGNFTCIRCNITYVGLIQEEVNPGEGWVINVNATDPITGLQTNNTHIWGRLHTDSLNETLGVAPANWSTHTNLTMKRWVENDGDGLINSTLNINENFSIGNFYIDNSTMVNISAGNETSIGGDLVVDGELYLGSNTKLNATGNATLLNSGLINAFQGSPEIYFGALNISTGGIYNGTPGTTNITNNDWTNNGNFTHNSGRVIFSGGVGETQQINGNTVTSFFNLNITNTLSVNQTQDAFVRGVLDIASGARFVMDGNDRNLFLNFGNDSGGTKIINTGTFGFANTNPGGNFATINGTSGQHPVQISGNDFEWGVSQSGLRVDLVNLDFQMPVTTGGGLMKMNVINGNVSFAGLTLNTEDRLNISNGSNVTLSSASSLILDGRIHIRDGLLFNASYNGTIFSVNGSDIMLYDVASTPADAADIDGNSIVNTELFVNVTNLSNVEYMDLNFTFNSTLVTADQETTLSVYKFNDSDSKWYNTSGGIDTVNNIAYLENYQLVGSVFAPVYQDTSSSSTTTTSTSSGSSGGSTGATAAASVSVSEISLPNAIVGSSGSASTGVDITNNRASTIEVRVVKQGLEGVAVKVKDSLSLASEDVALSNVITIGPGKTKKIEFEFSSDIPGKYEGTIILQTNIVGNSIIEEVEIPVSIEFSPEVPESQIPELKQLVEDLKGDNKSQFTLIGLLILVFAIGYLTFPKKKKVKRKRKTTKTRKNRKTTRRKRRK